jgi:dTDP-4-dehydrorhamnose reductase
MSVLILGGAGMAGHKFVQHFSKRGLEVACTIRGRKSDPPISQADFFKEVEVHEGVDVSDLPALRSMLERLAPQVLINCVGIIKQRDEAKSAIPSITINALLPHLLAEWAEAWGGRVIHFSTDCVFTGDRGNYAVDDKSDALDLYGKTKFLGEVQRSNATTLRTSIIGRELTHLASLVEWFLAQNGQTIRGFTRAIYTGVTTDTMADLVFELITKHPEVHGLHHVVSEKISKYDLLLLMRDAFGLDVEINPDDSFFCDRSMLDSGLCPSLGFQIPSWQEQIQRMADDPTPYGTWIRK